MTQTPKCFFCGDAKVTKDNWCSGCEHYICNNCDKVGLSGDQIGIMGGHIVEDHAGKPESD